MKRDLVTVIVPIYNVEQYLNRCIQSIVDQTYQNLEILLIDDGSPDNCPAMCDEWANRDSRICVIHKDNQGLGMARNTGLEHASGEYVCYFDSDDYVAVDTIEQAYNALVQNNADLAIFEHCHVYPDGRRSPFHADLQKTVFTGEEITNELLPWLIQPDRRKEPKCSFALSAWSGLLRRIILENNHIRFQSEREIISEDTLYLLELYAKLNTVVLIPKPLYYYSVNPFSLTKTYQKERQSKNNAFLNSAQKIITEQGFKEEIRIRMMMLYLSFSLEAMKHIVRMPLTYRKKRELLFPFFADEELTSTIAWNTISRCGIRMRIFLVCLKWKLQSLCFLLLCLRENIIL